MSLQPTTEEMRAWLSQELDREITISQVRLKGIPGFMVDYINHTAPATKLVAETEEGAIAALFTYLQSAAPLPAPDGTEDQISGADAKTT